MNEMRIGTNKPLAALSLLRDESLVTLGRAPDRTGRETGVETGVEMEELDADEQMVYELSLAPMRRRPSSHKALDDNDMDDNDLPGLSHSETEDSISLYLKEIGACDSSPPKRKLIMPSASNKDTWPVANMASAHVNRCAVKS